MTINRRAALGSGAAVLAGLAAQPVLAQSQAHRIRRGVSQMSEHSDDVVAFREGVEEMKRLGGSNRLSWAWQNDIHRLRAQHGNGLFLPWHRLQLAHLERIIGALTGHRTFALPYWDWQGDRFLPNWLTRPGSSLYERQRAPGVDVLDFSRARWSAEPRFANLVSDRFTNFAGGPRSAGNVELYGHNLVHTLTGGLHPPGLMSRPETAAGDPVFWLHHCNVDRVWATWHRNVGPRVYPQEWAGIELDGFIGPQGQDTGPWRVGGVIETRSLGYSYDEFYPFPRFNPQEDGPDGATAREPLGGTVYKMQVEATPGSAAMSLSLPDEAVRRLRAADDTLMISGVGTASFVRDEGLHDRSLEVGISTGGRRLSLGSSPTFVHVGGPHANHGDYAIGYSFGAEILNLVADGDGPVSLTVEAEDLSPEDGRPPARMVGMELALTLTESRWV